MKKGTFLSLGLALAMAVSTTHALAGDAEAGKALYKKKCGLCHKTAEGEHKLGPSLFKVAGSTSASTSFAKYTDALKGANLTWDDETLDKWLTDPKAMVPDTKQGVKLKEAADRANIIAYLKTLN